MSEQGGPEPTVPQSSEPVEPPPSTPSAPLVAWDAPAATPPGPQPAAPLVPWAPPPWVPPGGGPIGTYADGPPSFTVGALLSDTFARYGADFLRLFIVAAAASGISWLSSFASLPAPGASPFVRSPGFVDVSGILGLVSFVLGLIGSATIFALAEGGRALPLTRAIRRGVERAGWLFLTSLIIVAAFFAAFLLALIPIGLFAVISPGLAVILVLVLVVVFIWASLRLSLALPANVADNRNSIEAVKLSWRVTKPVAVWGRLLTAAFLFGLLFVPAAIGTMLLVFPAMFGAIFGSSTGSIPVAVVLLVPSIVFSVFTPLTALLSFSAYRRLVPPLQPSWTTPQAPPAAPAPPVAPAVAAAVAPPRAVDPAVSESTATEARAATEPPGTAAAPAPATDVPPSPAPNPAPAPAEPSFRVPRLGTAGTALLALAIVADAAGIAVIPYGVGEMERFVRDFRGFPGLTPGTGLPSSGGVGTPGQVTFASSVDLDTCTGSFPVFITSPEAHVAWLAVPRRPVTPQDEVFVQVTRDGEVIDTRLQDPGSHDCFGSEEAIPGLQSGVYVYQLIVNGSVDATGTLLVQ